MIIDTSALVAILRSEPECETFLTILSGSSHRGISAGSWIELAAVLSKYADQTVHARLRELISLLDIEVRAVSVVQAQIGHDAYREFGKGQHRARPNFGDCFAYALAKETGEPLLFKGDDFTHTDIASAR